MTALKNSLAADGIVEDLRATGFHLPDGQAMAVTSLAVSRRQGHGQTLDPLGKESLDLLGPQLVADRLQTLGIGTGQKAVIQNLEGDTFLARNCCLAQLVAVETAIVDGIRRIAAHLDEGRP